MQHFISQLDNLIEYIDYGSSLNYGKLLKSSYSGLKKCTTYQNVSMCESARSKSGLTNNKVTGGRGAKNFAYYTLTYPDGSTSTINISRRFTWVGSTVTIYVKNTVTGKEIKGTGGCWYNYTGHKRTACFGLRK